MAVVPKRVRITLTSENPEHRIPRRSLEGDLQVAEAVQAVFGLRFQEHGQGVATALAGEEYFVAIQFQTHATRSQNEVAGGAAWPARGTSPFNPQLFHRTQIA